MNAKELRAKDEAALKQETAGSSQYALQTAYAEGHSAAAEHGFAASDASRHRSRSHHPHRKRATTKMTENDQRKALTRTLDGVVTSKQDGQDGDRPCLNAR